MITTDGTYLTDKVGIYDTFIATTRSYCQTNEYYAVADLTKTQQLLLGDFTDFGLLFRQRTSSDRFYTTSLAVNLIFGGSTGQKRTAMTLSSSFAGVRLVRARV